MLTFDVKLLFLTSWRMCIWSPGYGHVFYSLNGIIFQQYSGGVNALLNASWQLYFVYIISNSYRVIHCRICFPNICIFLAYFVLSVISKLKCFKSYVSYLPYCSEKHHILIFKWIIIRFNKDNTKRKLVAIFRMLYLLFPDPL